VGVDTANVVCTPVWGVSRFGVLFGRIGITPKPPSKRVMK